MIHLAGVGLALFLLLLLLGKHPKSIADYLLAGWLLLIAAHLFLFSTGRSLQNPALLGAEIPLPLAHGPFLFLYTRALTQRSIAWWEVCLHFVPFLGVLAYVIPFMMLTAEEKLWVYQHNGAGYETFSYIKNVLIMLSGIVYVAFSYVELRRHRKNITRAFSSIEKINLQWMQYLIYWIAIIWLAVIFGNDDWVFGAAVVFVLFIGYFGIKQAGVFHAVAPVESTPGEGASADTQEKPKYQKSGLSAAQADALHHQLKRAMEENKFFLQRDLSLADLAQQLGVLPNHLSQVINERESKNFYDYINTLRIAEFKRLAADPASRKYTLLALAQESGFQSKSSFQRYFKKVAGQSPSDYLESLGHRA